MSPLPALSPLSSAHLSRAVGAVRGLEESNSFRTLDGECSEQGADRRSERRAPAPSQFGTGRGAPLWNGPRLMPAFVAQVLGQVMMDPRDRASGLAPAAYRIQAPQIPQGSFFNHDI
jgi:hypothetical protein